MHEILRAHIIARLGQTPEGLDEVLTFFHELALPRNAELLAAGEVCRYVYFVVSGSLQAYVLDEAGKHSIRDFYLDEAWMTDILGFQEQKPSREYIRSIEPCQLLRIHYDDFQPLMQQVPGFFMMYRQILEISYNNAVYRVNILNSLDALGRLRWLMEHQPKILTRIPSRLVASYIGVTPETFTRLKARS